ncbi:hypothetical protein [Runella sp. SP2]|uniref:hypothetical protein n=1 Tax=Runella sp. SP2 TaxID=2268026 RepID=UPI000F07C781|nr:hypothetical protein [Runella sp. SP2]AYQ31418.1 hypothetical protein DTQ70_04140 [Runella sp. SP2]
MVKTIFTGHTLDLKSILAIGPVMQKTDALLKTLYFEITLKGGSVIWHGFYFAETGYAFNEKQWNENIDSSKEQRRKLVEEWIAANKGFSFKII